jgi:hypothetical protein
VSVGREETLTFTWALDTPDLDAPSGPRDGRPFVRFTIDASSLLMQLTSAAIWNNLEGAALIQCERAPDEHDPTLHSLMSFFTL